MSVIEVVGAWGEVMDSLVAGLFLWGQLGNIEPAANPGLLDQRLMGRYIFSASWGAHPLTGQLQANLLIEHT